MQKGFVFGLISSAGLFGMSLRAQPVITQDPKDHAAVYGAPVSFSVAAQGSGSLRYQWQFNGQDLPGARARMLNFIATPTRAGAYSVRVVDGSGERQSALARLEVVPRPVIVGQPKNVVVGVHQTALFEARLNNSGPYSRVIWHNYNPPEGSHEIPTNLGFPVDQLSLEIPNCLQNDSYNGLYWIAVTNAAAGTVSRRAKLTVVGPPVYTEEPQDRTVRKGGIATFMVRLAPDAAGSKTLQWYREGVPIPGATRPRLTLLKVQPEDGGNYYCIATSIGGSSPSWGARLTVSP